MTQQTTRCSSTQLLALFCGIVLIFLFAMHYRLGQELADDGAFFLRYAENMLRGEFWVWNLGERPVWGASAPLYPLIVALPMALGISPVTAIIGVSLTLSSLSLAAVTLMLGHRFGVITGLAFLAFSTLDTGVMYFSGAGLESPLTIALLAFAVWTLLYKPKPWVIGLASGLLMVNKLDLVPVGCLLLLAHWLQDKRFPKLELIIATTIALVWYGYAWWHFGAPVPNSFLTKALHQNNQPKIIDWTWFGSFIFWVGIHKWLTALSAFALWRSRRTLLPLIIVLGGTLVTHLIVYTIKYPFEPYNWYAVPSLFALLIGGAIGLGLLAGFTKRWLPNNKWAQSLTAILMIAIVFAVNIKLELLGTENIKMFASHQEFDRSQAGRWVNENTPKNFVVYTMWGNPAYYSQRKVLDGSFLNRSYEQADLIKKYRPEILILQNNPGSTPMNPVFAATKGEGYRVVKVFDKTYSAGMDYFFAILARDDVIDKISNIDPPRNLMAFISNVHLGDHFGILKPQDQHTFFVHPGATSVTSFNFAAEDYLQKSSKRIINVYARIAPNIPQDAIKRGGGNVRVRISQGDKQIIDRIVRVGESFRQDIPISNEQPLSFVVDNNHNPDSDWLLLSIQ